MLKLYLYDTALPHIHDSMPEYENCVPMSKVGIAKHFTPTQNPEEADYFYMGQFSDGTPNDRISPAYYPYFEALKERHICDIEGDWPNRQLPSWLAGSIITINGLSRNDAHMPKKHLVRPTFSKLLVHMSKQSNFGDSYIKAKHAYAFKGLPDPHGVRSKMAYALINSELPKTLEFNSTWNCPADPNSDISTVYQELIEGHSLSLCPRGNGKDSVRFFETCFLERIPVVIGSNKLFGEDYADLSFMEYIDESLTIGKMTDALKQIYKKNEPLDIRTKKFEAARNYFDTYVKSYFADPTAYFIERCLK